MSASPPNAAPRPEPDRLAGLVERVTFHNADSGFCVLRLKVKGERELITLVGHTPTVAPGEYASASGTWVTDREHGRQFKAVFVRISPPNTLTGIERYLGSGMVKGIAPDSPLRARAGVSYALSEAAGEGHCGLPRSQLVSFAVKLLEIPQPIIEDAIDQELAEEVVIADTVDGVPSVFLAQLYNAERSIVSQVKRLKSGSPPWTAFDADKAIPWVEQKLAIQLADSQKQAIRLALSSKLLVITGGEPLRDKDECRPPLGIGPRVKMQHRMDHVLHCVQHRRLSAARDRQQAFDAQDLITVTVQQQCEPDCEYLPSIGSSIGFVAVRLEEER